MLAPDPPPIWMALFGFVVGAAIGSFLNMLIWRLPRRISFFNPSHSICPRCRHPLAGKDLIPIFSWLYTKGRCRYCDEPISGRYMGVELLTGAIFGVIWYQQVAILLNPNWGLLIASWMVAAALIAIIFIDWELYIIPDELNAFLTVVPVIYHALAGSLSMALWGWFAGWAAIWGLAFLGRVAFGKDAMGHGDIKMMRGVGAFIGPLMVIPTLLIAVVLGLVAGVIGMALAKRQTPASEETRPDDLGVYEPESVGSLTRLGIWYLLALDIPAIFFPKMYRWIGETQEEVAIEDDPWEPSLSTIPFGPYLAAGALACLMFGGPIRDGIERYWAHQTGAELSQDSEGIPRRENRP